MSLEDRLAELIAAIGGDVASLDGALALLGASDDPSNPQVLIDHFFAGSGETGEVGSANWSFTNGTVTNINNEAGHPGMILLRTSGTANQVCSLYLGSNAAATILRMDEWQRFCWIFAPVTNSADTAYQIGMMSAFGALAPVHGVYLERLANDNNWFFVCRNNNVETRVNSGIAFAATWFKLNVRRISAAQVAFSLNNGAEVILNTNIPDTADSFNIGLQRTTNAAVTRDLKLDFFSAKLLPILT